MILDVIFFIIVCLILIKSGSMLVDNLNKIAIFLGLSEFTLAFILMAFGTSVPELFIGISSAINKIPVLSLGNIIGANIADIAMVLGIVILLTRKIKVKSEVSKDMIYVLLLAAIPIILMLDYELSRRDGALLLIAFAFYLARLLKQRRKLDDKLNNVSPFAFVKSCFWLFIGIILLLISSHFVVKTASLLATEFGASLMLIGLLIVAIGTTLPELVFSTKASLSGHNEMSIGNLLGSVVVNSTLILGLVSLINPIRIADFAIFFSAIFFLIFILVFLTVLFRFKKELVWQDGIILILLYITFIIIEFYAKGGSAV